MWWASGRSVQKCNSFWLTDFKDGVEYRVGAIAQSSTRRHVYRRTATNMSFKQLLRGGSPGDQKNRVTPERVTGSDGRPRSAGRSISVLYVGEPRETRLISGAFTYDHPQLSMDVSANL